MANLSSPATSHLAATYTSWVAGSPISTAILSLVILCLAFFMIPRRPESDDIPRVGRVPLFTAWSFFGKRNDFIMSAFRETRSKIFQFKVLNVSLPI